MKYLGSRFPTAGQGERRLGTRLERNKTNNLEMLIKYYELK